MPRSVPSATTSRARETVLDCTIAIVVLSILILLLASAYPSGVKLEGLGPDVSTISSFTLSMNASTLTSTSKSKESVSIADTSTKPGQSSSWVSLIPPQLSISASVLLPTSASSRPSTHVPPPPPTSTPRPSQALPMPSPSTSRSIPRWFNLFFYEKPNFEGKETYKILNIDECMDIGPPLSPGSAKTWDDTTICYLYALSDCTWDALKPKGRLAVDDKSPAEDISGGMYLSAQCFVKA